MTRAIGIPTSLAILVIAPFLIAGEPKKEDAPPAAVESALTVAADEDTMLVKVRAAGKQPKAGEGATLASDDGRKSTTVTASSEPKCGGATMRKVALGTEVATDWCLRLAGIPDHGEVAGKVKGESGVTASDPGTELTLTVNRRHPFVGLPLYLLGTSLGAGLLLALLGPLLSRSIGLSRLGLLVARNEIAPVHERIGGLRDWVEARKAEGDDASTLRTQLQRLLKSGPAKAREARRGLRTALKGDPLGADHGLAKAAEREAKRRGHRIGDFRDDDGKEAVHPATSLAAAVTAMKQRKADIDAAEADMHKWLNEDCQPTDKLSAARLAWKRVLRADEVSDADDAYASLRTAVDEAYGRDECRKPGVTRETGPGAERSLSGVVDTAALVLEKTGLLTLLLELWMLITLAAIGVSVAFAGATVAVAVYDANETFGSAKDYFELASAGLASSAAATVLGLLAPWRSAAAAPEE
jgi:hypothetical protein